MKTMAEKSPCLACERVHQDKNDCVKDCAAIDAYLGRSAKAAEDNPFKEEPMPAVKLSVAEAEKTLGPEKVQEIMQDPEPPAPKMCKNHPDRPSHVSKKGHYTGHCLECHQERGRRNAKKSDFAAMGQASGSARREKKIKDPPDLGPGEITLPPMGFVTIPGMDRLLLEKLPAFNSSWPPELQNKWFEVFLELVIRTTREESHV